MSDDSNERRHRHSRHRRKAGLVGRLLSWWVGTPIYRAYAGFSERLYEWWHPRSESSRGYYGYGESRRGRLGRAWRRASRWVGRSAPMRAWRYAMIRLYDWWHPVSKSDPSRPGYSYYGHQRRDRLTRAWRWIARTIRHSWPVRLWGLSYNAFYNWWYPLTDDLHAYPAYGYYGRRRRSRSSLVLGWVRHWWRHAWIGRAWRRVLVAFWEWWYPVVESSGTEHGYGYYGRRRLSRFALVTKKLGHWWRHSWPGRVWRRAAAALWEWWYPEVESSESGYGYGYYGHRRLSRYALAVRKVSRWWRHSWLGRTWRRFSLAAWEWWYPAPDATSGGYGYGQARRVSRPVRFIRRALRWFRRTWLGRKLKWVLDDLEEFTFYIGWRFRQDFGWWRIRQWMLRWQTWTLLVCFVSLTGLGYTYGLPRYRELMERQYAQQADLWLTKGDLPRAMLRARQTLSLNASNAVATRVFGDVADLYNSPWAMYWRTRSVIFKPTGTNQLALASTALRFEGFPFPTAAKALGEVAPEVRNTASYHLIAGAMALRMKNVPQAEHHYSEALRLEPDNVATRMSLAVVRLHSQDPKILKDSRTTLELLRTDSNLGLMALRSLVAESIDRREFDRAESLSEQVLTNAQAMFADRILHLSILKVAKRPTFEAYLKETQEKASKNVFAIGEVVAWMIPTGHAREALDWLNSLPGTMARQGFLPISVGDAHVALGQWKELESYLMSAPWPGLDHVRFAMLTLARWKQTGGQRQSAAWNMAVRAASLSPGALNTLAELAASWGWGAEAENTIWHAVERFPDQTWPLQTLEQFYMIRRDSLGLLRVYAARLRKDPEDRLAVNNYAMMSLLMNRDLGNAEQLAADLHAAEPTNPIFSSTHAFSLHLQGRTKEAIEVVRSLGPAALEDPSLSLYFGVMLTTDGQKDAAEPYLRRAATAYMLPEEMALLRQATSGG